MRAIVYERYGTPGELKLREMPMPQPADDEVLVRVHAASVNSWDWDLVRGKPKIYRLLFGLFRPRYPVIGSDISGTVESVGTEIRQFKPGDEVFGDISPQGFGAFAEFARARERSLALKPKNTTFMEAAAIPQAGLLALQALRYKGSIQPGQKVLIIAAGGGVGSFAIQLAKLQGAEVHAVDSAEKLEFMLSLGADKVFDYTIDDVTRKGHTYDRILDNMAHRPLSDYRGVLRRGGVYVMTGGQVRRLLRVGLFGWLERNITAGLLPLQVNSHDLDALKRLVETGKLRAVVDKVFPLKQTAAALQLLGEAKVKGKVVVQMH